MRPDQALQDRRLHPVATWVLGCEGPFFRVLVPRSSAGYLLPGVLLGAHTSSLCLWPTPNSTRTQLPFQSFFPIFFPKRLPSTVIFLVVQCCLFLSLVPVIFSLKLVRSFLFYFLLSVTHQWSIAEWTLLALAVHHHVRKMTLSLLPERSVTAAGTESAARSVAKCRLSSPSAPNGSYKCPRVETE